MYMQIRLPLACLLIMIYCYWYYKSKKRLPTRTSMAYEAMMVAALIHLAAAAVTEYTVNNRELVPEPLNYIWHLVYLVSINCVCCLLLYYLLLYIERGTRKPQKAEKTVLLLVCLAGAAAQIFLPIQYVDTSHGSYSLGMKAYSLYCVVIFVLIMMLVKLFRYRKLIGEEKSIAFFASIAIFIIVSVIQICYPYMLLTSLGLTMILLGFMVNGEDAYLYISYSTGLYNELGCREIIQERILECRAISVGVYVFLGNDREVKRAISLLAEKIPEKKKNLMCGMMADNVLVVLPVSKWVENPQLLKELPLLEEENDLKYSFEVLEFSDDKNADQICDVLRDCKNRFMEEVLHKDELTGLLRREAFIRKVGHLIVKETPFSLLMVDLDDFKSVNDTFGHSVGDAVLEFTADTFRTVLRSSDVISRIGGDEFAIALYGVTDKKLIKDIVNRMLETLAFSNVLPDENHRISLSVGVKIHRPEDGATSFEELYEKADSALYHAKYSGKSGMSFDS